MAVEKLLRSKFAKIKLLQDAPHHRSLTPLGNYLRRMKAKLGPQAATMATAHKIAVIFYTMIKNQVEYDETIWDARDAQREKKLQAKLKRQAKQLGYELVPMEPQAA